MKRRFLTGLATAAMLTSVAVPVTNNMFLSNQAVEASATSDAFLSKVSLQAQKMSKKYGVYASLMLAQAALESGWGTSTLSTQANNFFGMKATGWTGATYSVKTAEQDGNGKTYYIVAPFRKYISYQASFDDYGLKMRTTLDNYGGLRYSKTWLESASSPSASAKAIKAASYATDKNYASKLINHITSYNLTKYDPVYSSDVYTVKVAKSGATYLYPTDHAVSPKRSYVTAGKDVTVTKTFTYYNGKKRMYLKGLGWINGEDLNTGSSQAPSADTSATVSGQMKILMHSAAIYTSTGAKSSAKSVKAGKSMMTYGSVTINGAKYYRANSASADQFIKASNFDGSRRKLKHNAYLYNSKGKRVGKSKWLKGSSHTVYGGSVKIKHKQYYIVGLNQYVKKGNF
ncbi:glucosaminidase domain-containing protein [Lactobacillus delbrueckii]|uniref:glucosaminidase domain-containing protein n=1 Tax=Lactobacillus delbrueckii TaxID=1584 RepID=UPI0000E5550E|nr:glucosaminidase domain-containing protein [Lactobacillus delbrueckii]ABJ57874.1 Muramidase (flagellum-specific) [Lactobacillus delbrueckii subsp. bulgaricus ATCC BAA-365]MBT8938098.1 amidase [Lactobacillus delbrueckii subsp. bulgaricus]